MVSRILIFLAKIGQVQIAEDVQPVVHRDRDHVAEPTHVFPLVGNVLDGGAGLEPAAVEPHHDRAFFVITSRRPHVQILAVLVHHPVTVRHLQLPVRFPKLQQRAHVAKARRVEDSIPRLHLLRRVETPALRIGNSLENGNTVIRIPLHLSFRGLHHVLFLRTTKLFFHTKAPFLQINKNVYNTWILP